MDKRPVYPGAIPLDTDVLQPQRNVEIALGFIMQAAFGTGTVIDGLSVAQTTVASMQVVVGAGSIIQATTVDTLTSGFGSLAVDNADALVKIGVNLTATTMSVLTAPATTGQSQNWLVEAQFVEADGVSNVLQYYNSTNPAVPYSGPSNSGAAQNTARTNRVQLQWKGGTAATTGTQNTPSPDAGWSGVAIVTVANGQTTITSSSIAPYSLAPYVPTKLAFLRKQLQGNLNVYVATTGSDTANSGLSVSSPFLTLQKAWNYIVNSLDLNGFSVTVNVANGTYSSGLVAVGSPVGYGTGNTISFVGNTTTPTNCVISTSNAHCLVAQGSASISVAGFSVAASGAVAGISACGVLSNFGASITLSGNMNYSACTGQHIFAGSAATVLIGASYSISGNAAIHLSTYTSSLIQTIATSLTVTLTGTLSFSNSFAVSTNCSNISVTSANLAFNVSGATVTGIRYTAQLNGIIFTNGSGATYFPGSTSGAIASGGVYN